MKKITQQPQKRLEDMTEEELNEYVAAQARAGTPVTVIRTGGQTTAKPVRQWDDDEEETDE